MYSKSLKQYLALNKSLFFFFLNIYLHSPLLRSGVTLAKSILSLWNSGGFPLHRSMQSMLGSGKSFVDFALYYLTAVILGIS